MAVQPAQCVHQLRRAEGLLRQRIQFGTLLGGEAVAEALRGGGTLGQRIQELIDIARVLREVLAVLGHEIVEVVLGVLATGVFVQQVVEVVEHLVDGLAVFVTGVLQRLFHAGEALIEYFPSEQVLDLLVFLLRFGASPLVLREFLHRLGG